MKNEHKMVREMRIISDLISKGEYQKALDSLRDLETQNPEDRIINSNKVGFLIDIGFGSKKSKIIKEGIATGEKILSDPSYKDYEIKTHYNVANGNMSLYQLEYDRNKGVEQLVDNKNLQETKHHFRKAIKGAKHLDSEFRKQLWTNYGNCLYLLGRMMEALYAYDEVLKIDPRFPIPLVNKAMLIRNFADISGSYKEPMYIKSYQMLRSAKDNEDSVKFGGISAKKSIENEIQHIENLFENKNLLSQSLKHTKYNIRNKTTFEKFYINFCSKHKLFLNFHIHEDECEASIVDPIFINLITPIDDNETFYNLAKYINQIKEDYMIARLLLVQSQFRRKDFNNISKRTTFVNTLDYSIFNIYIGLLKSAFEEAYNILDKISRFINEYYKLGIQGKIYFPTIWQYEDNKKVRKIKPEILNSKNISLYALYDIFLDFKSDYYKRIQEIRNVLVHERLVIYDWTKLDRENKYNIGYETMLSQTIDLLQLVKSAIIYLINFVNLEENKKKKKSTGLIGPMYVDTTQFL